MVEVMQEVRDQRHVVIRTELHFERVAGLHVDALAHTLRGRVLPGNLEYWRPVHGRYLHLRVPLRERDAEDTV